MPEHRIREILKKVVESKKDSRNKTSMDCDSRFNFVDDENEDQLHRYCDRFEEIIEDQEDCSNRMDEEEEEGDGEFVSDPYYFDDGDLYELRMEELGPNDEEEEEEDELAYMRPVQGYVVTPEDDSEYEMPGQNGFGPSPPSSYSWQSTAPPPTPLATSYSTTSPFLNQSSSDMNSFLSMVSGRLNDQRAPPVPFDSAVPFGTTTTTSADVEPIEG